MRLRTLVAVEIITQFVAKGNDAKQLLLGHKITLFRRIEVFDNAAQFGKVRTHARVGIHPADRFVQEAVRLRRCFHNFLAAHIC